MAGFAVALLRFRKDTKKQRCPESSFSADGPEAKRGLLLVIDMTPDSAENRSPFEHNSSAVRWLVVSMSFAFSFAVFWYLRDTNTDNDTHRLLVVKLMAGEADWPPNFLYYAALGLLGSALNFGDQFFFAACLLLSFSVALKAAVTSEIMRILAPSASSKALLAATFSLLIVFSIPVAYLSGFDRAYYIGQITPNVWHNSTTIFLMPVAIIAFWLQARAFETKSVRYLWAITVLVAISVMIKPSFFMAYAPVICLWLLFNAKDRGVSFAYLIPVVVGLVLTLGLYILIYEFQQGKVQATDSGIALKPFVAWRQMIPGFLIPLSAAASLMTPLFYVMLGFRGRNRTALHLAALMILASLIIFSLLVETGGRDVDGNFYWQVVVSSYLLHLIVVGELVEHWSRNERRRRVIVCLVPYAAMLLSGLYYLYRLIVVGVPLPY